MIDETLVVAIPSFRPEDLELIQKVRKEFDAHWTALPPHLTLVFPQSSVAFETLEAEISKALLKSRGIRLRIRRAMVMPPQADKFSYCFFLPEEGCGEIARLHDELYSGSLKKELRLDLPYFPHIRAGKFLKTENCKQVVDKINFKPLEIPAEVLSIQVLRKIESRYEVLKDYRLATSAYI